MGNSVGYITAAAVIPTVASARASRNMCGGYRYINRDRGRGALLSYALNDDVTRKRRKNNPRAPMHTYKTCV